MGEACYRDPYAWADLALDRDPRCEPSIDGGYLRVDLRSRSEPSLREAALATLRLGGFALKAKLRDEVVVGQAASSPWTLRASLWAPIGGVDGRYFTAEANSIEASTSVDSRLSPEAPAEGWIGDQAGQRCGQLGRFPRRDAQRVDSFAEELRGPARPRDDQRPLAGHRLRDRASEGLRAGAGVDDEV